MVVTTGAIRHAKLQSNDDHQQNNTQLLTGRMPFLFLSPTPIYTEGNAVNKVGTKNGNTRSVKSTEGKVPHYTDFTSSLCL